MNSRPPTAKRLSLLLGLFASGCASLLPTVVPEAQGEFKPTGTIQRGKLGASFDSARVISPSITLSKRTDGSWGGRFALAGSGDPQAIDVSVTDTAIRGVDFVLTRETPKPGTTVLVGAFKGKNFRFEISKDAFLAHTTRNTLEFGNRIDDEEGAHYGERGALDLTGDAAQVDPIAWPQLALALVAAFY